MEIQWSDNVKARHLDFKKINEYKRNDEDLAVQSQEETYYYFRRKNEKEAEAAADNGKQMAADVSD